MADDVSVLLIAPDGELYTARTRVELIDLVYGRGYRAKDSQALAKALNDESLTPKWPVPRSASGDVIRVTDDGSS